MQSILASCTPTPVEINHFPAAPSCSVYTQYGQCLKDCFCVPFILIYMFASLFMLEANLKANVLPVHFSVSVPVVFSNILFQTYILTEKLQKLYQTFSYTSHSTSPNANILHNHCLSINNRKITLIQYFK